MAKKRKLDGAPSPTASDSSEEQISVQEQPSSFDAESLPPFPIEPLTEPSWPPEIQEPINELPLIDQDPNPQTLETPNPNPDPIPPGAVAESDPAENDEEDDENDPLFLQKLLEPFSKDQVISILRDAALKHPDIWDSLKQIADHDPAHRKVFVHGLGWNATVETLTDSFQQYGEIEDCNAIVDKITGRCKGYGFILFKHRSGARKALKEPQKKIGNKMTACQLASEGPPPASSAHSPAFLYSTPAPNPTPSFLPVSEYTQRKIYVSNVGADLDPNKILQFFSKFGEIEEGPLGLDKTTGKPKGFCLFVYKSVDSARKALEEPHKNFEGHILHCQRAIDGPKISKQGGHLYHGGGQFVQHGKSGFGAHGMPSSVSGPGHLIAPPAASLRFNQAGQPNAATATGYNPTFGLAVKNAGHGNQIRAAGGYAKPGAVGAHGASLRIHGSYGNAAMGQGTTWNQQGFNHAGGLGSSTGQ